MSTIDAAMNKCGSKQEFISEMQKHGYELTWTDERKYITFTCPNGKKCRDKTLRDEKYLKENIGYELHYREQHHKTRKQFAGEINPEERARDRRNAERHHANYGSDPRKGLGYNGRSLTVNGGFSAECVRVDGAAADCIKDGKDDAGVVENAAGTLQVDAGGDEGKAQNPADRSREPSASDAGTRATGWESSRGDYERYLGKGQGTGESYRQCVGKNQSPHLDYSHGDIGRSIDIGGGIVSSALRSLAGITDGGEDPEERRKRIEAEQSASNLGAIIGLAVSAISAAVNTGPDDLPKELEEEQNEIKMNF